MLCKFIFAGAVKPYNCLKLSELQAVQFAGFKKTGKRVFEGS